MESISIADMILNGASLSSVMVPDPAIESNYPAHDETYKMNFIYLDGHRLFGQTRMCHRSIRNKSSFSSNNAFAYSVGYKRQMLIMGQDVNNSIWGTIPDRYSKFEWKVKEDHELVWSSDTPNDVTALREAILEGEDFRLHIKDEDGYWSVLPVDLANLEQDSDEFVIRTEVGYVPSFLPEKKTLLDSIDMIIKKRVMPEQMVTMETILVPIYYCCYSNGTYYTYFDEPRDIDRRYEELKIFVKKEAVPTVHTISYEDAHNIFMESNNG